MTLFEKLENVLKKQDNNTYKIIAKNLRNAVMNGTILNQKELAKKSYVSESTITKFCYFLGYQGFKMMVKEIKKDIEYFFIEPSNAYKKSVVDIFGQWLAQNETKIIHWADVISTKKVINVYYSLLSEESASFLYSLLLILKKAPILKSKEIEVFERDLSDYQEHEIDIFLFFGRDNDSLKNVCELKINKFGDENILLIASEKQENKLHIKPKNSVSLSFEGSINHLYKQTAIQLFLLEVFRKIKTSQ